MRTLGLLLCLFAAPQALAGVPLCCVVPGSDCCAPETVEPEPACCPHCAPENDAPQEAPPATCDCPMRHTLWTTSDQADTHVDPLPAIATVAHAATVPLRALATDAPLRRTPHRPAVALSLPLLL